MSSPSDEVAAAVYRMVRMPSVVLSCTRAPPPMPCADLFDGLLRRFGRVSIFRFLAQLEHLLRCRVERTRVFAQSRKIGVYGDGRHRGASCTVDAVSSASFL